MKTDLSNLTLYEFSALIIAIAAFLKALEQLINKVNNYIRHIVKKDSLPLEEKNKEFNTALINVNGQINDLRQMVNNHDALIIRNQELLGNDYEHLKRLDNIISSLQHKSDEDRYMNIKCFQVLIRNAIGIVSEEDLKRIDNELNEYILDMHKD